MVINCRVLGFASRARIGLRLWMAQAVLLVFSVVPVSAQPNQPAMSPAEFITSTVWYFLIGLAIYWMLVLKPSQAKQDAQKEFLDNLKKNDEVMISGGIFGRVFGVRPEFITVEIAQNVRVKVRPDQCTSVKSVSDTGTSSGPGKAEKAEKS